jgi:hypothetical protein
MTNVFVESNNPQILWASGAWHICLVKFIDGSAKNKLGFGIYKNNLPMQFTCLELEEIGIYTVSEAQRHFLKDPVGLGTTLLKVAQYLANTEEVNNEVVAIFAVAAHHFSPLRVVE